MRTRHSLAAALLVVVTALPIAEATLPAFAQDHDHASHDGRPTPLSELSPERRRDALFTYGQIICKCPSENWSKTLASCPDGCADEQKAMVLERLDQGWTPAQVVAEQVKLFGPKAAAAPGTASDGTLWVIGLLIVGGLTALTVLRRWSSRASSHAEAARDAQADEPVASDDETAAVERELRGIE